MRGESGSGSKAGVKPNVPTEKRWLKRAAAVAFRPLHRLLPHEIFSLPDFAFIVRGESIVNHDGLGI